MVVVFSYKADYVIFTLIKIDKIFIKVGFQNISIMKLLNEYPNCTLFAKANNLG